MKTIAKLNNLYKWYELSEKALKKAQQNYLIYWHTVQNFEDVIKEKIKSLYPNSKLNCNFTFDCNSSEIKLYGNVSLGDIGIMTLGLFETVKIKYSIIHTRGTCFNTDLKWLDDSFTQDDNLSEKDYHRIYIQISQKMGALGRSLIDIGENYFFEVDPEEWEEVNEVNKWLYSKDGTLYIMED